MRDPIFIFSLPRSGSTLLQRILASHDEIVTTAEPWVLLPFLYALKPEGAFAEYSHFCAALALQDFMKELPNGRDDYLEAVRLAVSSMYTKAMVNTDARYFLDKTPRYTLVCDDVMKVFPDGKYIFLWRNPLAIVSSILETWGEGRWNLFYHKVDLFKSLDMAIHTYMDNSDKCLTVKYEVFLEKPMLELKRIGDYLGIELDEQVLVDFSEVSFEGKMGDPTGTKEYNQISTTPVEKWKKILCNPWRKWWCKRYLTWLGKERLAIMGYDFSTLISELDEIPFSLKYFFSDLVRSFFGVLYCTLSLTVIKQKWRSGLGWKRIVNHN